MIQGYRREDPKSSPKLAVPVAITEHILDDLWSRPAICPQQEAVSDLINIAFYYLLRVGEYTKQSRTSTNTIPFRVIDITFRDADGNQIPNNSDLCTLLSATDATLRIPNQKNGVKGQCIHQQCTATKYSPIKSLARRVHHILHHAGPPTAPIYYFHHPMYTTWRAVTADTINKYLRSAAGAIDLYNLGYTTKDVSSHSLRAGGAMAMHLNGVDAITIRKMGRWKSDTFLMYIHEQISAFATGVSLKMSNRIPFRHIAGPTIVA